MHILGVDGLDRASATGGASRKDKRTYAHHAQSGPRHDDNSIDLIEWMQHRPVPASRLAFACLSNALPISSDGAAESAVRFYTNAPAAALAASSACSPEPTCSPRPSAKGQLQQIRFKPNEMKTSMRPLPETNKQLGASGLVEVRDSAVGTDELSEHRKRFSQKKYTLKDWDTDDAHPLANRERLAASIESRERCRNFALASYLHGSFRRTRIMQF
jgi:hypothetical protein